MRIKLVPNPKKPWAEDLSKEVAIFISGLGHEAVEQGADATICIGGDGTIFHAVYGNLVEGPILGIGTKTSYVCQLMRDSWKNELPNVLEKGKTVDLMSLSAETSNQTFKAINDFVIHANNYRILKITANVNGTSSSFYGDGIIASTSVGSEAYAYSAGGEQLKPTDRKISLVPICPYRRTFPPAVLEENAEVKITADKECAFILDGIFIRNLKEGEEVCIKKGKDITFYEGVGRYKQG